MHRCAVQVRHDTRHDSVSLLGAPSVGGFNRFEGFEGFEGFEHIVKKTGYLGVLPFYVLPFYEQCFVFLIDVGLA